MNKTNSKKTIKLFITITLVILFGAFFSVKSYSDELANLNNLVIQDYYKYTGKVMLYFDNIPSAKEYKVKVDNDECLTKIIHSSGEYLSGSILDNLCFGTHTISVYAIDRDNNIIASNSTVFEKSTIAGTYCDMPQIYIYTDEEVTDNYHLSSNVAISVIDKTNGIYSDVIDTQANIKIRGNSTASANKKPWNFKLNKKQSLFNMARGKKWCLLANAYDKSLIRNKMVFDFGIMLGQKYTPESEYVEVYINGKYNGNYLLTVPIQVKADRMDLDAYNEESNDILLELGTRYESDVNHFTTDVLKTTFDVNDPEKDGDLENHLILEKISRVKSFLNAFEQSLVDGDYEKIKQFINEDSFLDYYILCEYFKTADFNFSSTRFYIKDNKIYAGPLWDFDLSMGNLNPRTYLTYYGEDGISYTDYNCRTMNWYAKLFELKEFENKVKIRFALMQPYIKSLYEKGSSSRVSVDYYLNNYGESFRRDSETIDNLGAGWSLRGGGGYVGISYATTAKWTEWNQPIEFVRDWLQNRNEWLCDVWDVSNIPIEDTTTVAVETTTLSEEITSEAVNETTTETVESSSLNIKDKATTNKIIPTATKQTAKEKVYSFKAVKKKKSIIKVSFKRKNKGVSGYKIKIYRLKKSKKKVLVKSVIKINKKTIKIKSKLFKKYKKLYVKIKPFVKKNKKITYCSKWSKIKKIKKI